MDANECTTRVEMSEFILGSVGYSTVTIPSGYSRSFVSIRGFTILFFKLE